MNNHRAGAEDRALSSAKLLTLQIWKELFALSRERQIKRFWERILNSRISHSCSGTQLRDSAGRAQHRSFCAHGAPVQRLHLKKTLSVHCIYLPQHLVFPSAATFHVQEAALPPMGGWWTVRLRGRNALSQTKSFSSWHFKCSRSFSPISRLNRQDGGWGRGEGGSSTALWLSQGRAAGQTRGPDLNPGLPNPHAPAHTPLCSQGRDQTHCSSNQAHTSPSSKNK